MLQGGGAIVTTYQADAIDYYSREKGSDLPYQQSRLRHPLIGKLQNTNSGSRWFVFGAQGKFHGAIAYGKGRIKWLYLYPIDILED